MTNTPSTTTSDRRTDQPLPFEPYLPAVVRPGSRPGPLERLLTRPLRRR